jgi:hypothetical protein
LKLYLANHSEDGADVQLTRKGWQAITGALAFSVGGGPIIDKINRALDPMMPTPTTPVRIPMTLSELTLLRTAAERID